MKKGSKIKEGNEIKEGYKVKEVSETEIISLFQAKNPDQPKHITPRPKGRGEPPIGGEGVGLPIALAIHSPP